ncbi:hypothetical protein PVAG01_07757 [Phlyctema vagabunda]|uniref:Uncharacterized protein n=1 Tax=Phlyctema vagabunda TaxID=108571 RepID=A0ABR4PDU6_9HELO
MSAANQDWAVASGEEPAALPLPHEQAKPSTDKFAQDATTDQYGDGDGEDAFREPKATFQIDPEDDQRFGEFVEPAKVPGVLEDRLAPWQAVGKVADTYAGFHYTNTGKTPTSKLIFSDAQHRRGSLHILLRYHRSMTPDLNPIAATHHTVNIEIQFKDITRFHFREIDNGLTRDDLQEETGFGEGTRGIMNVDGLSELLVLVEADATQCLVQNSILPALMNEEDHTMARKIIEACQRATIDNPISIKFLLKDRLERESSLLVPQLVDAYLGTIQDRKLDPLKQYLRGPPRAGTLTKGNTVPWDELPRVPVQRAKVIHADKMEYSLNQVYGRVGEAFFEEQIVQEHIGVEFEAGHIALPDSVTVGELPNAYIGFFKFEGTGVLRPQPGDSYQVEYFAFEKPYPQHFVEKSGLHFYKGTLLNDCQFAAALSEDLEAEP